MSIADEVKKLLDLAKEKGLVATPQIHKENPLSFQEQLKLYSLIEEDSCIANHQERILSSIAKITEKIAQLRNYKEEHFSNEIIKFESYIEKSIIKLTEFIQEVVTKFLSTRADLKSIPPWENSN